jgi:hypothetical protein
MFLKNKKIIMKSEDKDKLTEMENCGFERLLS